MYLFIYLFIFVIGALPYYHFLLLPRRTWYHRRLRRHRSGLFQQCEAVASRNRSLRLRERQQDSLRQQVRSNHKEGRRYPNSEGVRRLSGHFLHGDECQEQHQC